MEAIVADGLPDFDEVIVHGTNPLVADTDGDGFTDGDEVSRNMNPNLTDTDSDGFADAVDNCPSAYNPFQLDRGGFDSIIPDGIGDACQNADFNRDGIVDLLDLTLLLRGLDGLVPILDPALPPSQP